MLPPDADRLAYALSDQQSNAILRDEIMPEKMPIGSLVGPMPARAMAVLLGGQPGAGKTALLHRAESQLRMAGRDRGHAGPWRPAGGTGARAGYRGVAPRPGTTRRGRAVMHALAAREPMPYPTLARLPPARGRMPQPSRRPVQPFRTGRA